MSTGTTRVRTKGRQLTERQAQTLDAIRTHIEMHGKVPSRRELCTAMGLKHQAAVDSHLHALQRKGWLALDPGQARGIRLLREDTPIVPPEDVPFLAEGTRVEAGDGDVQPQMQTAERLWSRFDGVPDYFLEVRDDSMNGTGINSGDLVAVRRNLEPREGDIVIARIGSDITMKRYYQTNQCVELRPQSTNPDHETIRIERHTDGEIVGVVVGAVISTRARDHG